MSLFGGPRHIRIASVGEEGLAAFTALLEAESAGNPVVAIAPTVKTTAKIVKLALDSPRAMAFGCMRPPPPMPSGWRRRSAARWDCGWRRACLRDWSKRRPPTDR